MTAPPRAPILLLFLSPHVSPAGEHFLHLSWPFVTRTLSKRRGPIDLMSSHELTEVVDLEKKTTGGPLLCACFWRAQVTKRLRLTLAAVNPMAAGSAPTPPPTRSSAGGFLLPSHALLGGSGFWTSLASLCGQAVPSSQRSRISSLSCWPVRRTAGFQVQPAGGSGRPPPPPLH